MTGYKAIDLVVPWLKAFFTIDAQFEMVFRLVMGISLKIVNNTPILDPYTEIIIIPKAINFSIENVHSIIESKPDRWLQILEVI